MFFPPHGEGSRLEYIDPYHNDNFMHGNYSNDDSALLMTYTLWHSPHVNPPQPFPPLNTPIQQYLGGGNYKINNIRSI